MAISLSTLVQRTRRFVRDWPEEDVLTASIASTTSVVSVADGTIYADNWLVEIDQENLFVSANGSATTFPARRGVRGSTAASHVSTSTVLIRPQFLYSEIVDALNWAKDECYPLIYRPVSLEFTGFVTNTFEYEVPTMTGLTVPIPYLSSLEIKPQGENDFRPIRRWTIKRGTTPFIQFLSEPEIGGTLRINGFGPFPDLATGDSLDAFWPVNAAAILPIGAASWLLASGEAGRVRTDTGVHDDREQANRAGTSMGAANALDARFRRSLLNAAMPPLPKHAKPTF